MIFGQGICGVKCRRKAGWLDNVLMDGEEGVANTIYKKTRAGAPDETSWGWTGRCDCHGPNCGKTTENGVVVTVVGVVGVVVVVRICDGDDREGLRLDWRLGKVQGVRLAERLNSPPPEPI